MEELLQFGFLGIIYGVGISAIVWAFGFFVSLACNAVFKQSI